MSTLVICLVVAGLAIATVTRLVVVEGAKPATEIVGNHRATPASSPEGAQPDPRPMGIQPPTAARRIRSAVSLVLLLGLVGALAALAVGALVLLIVGALRHAVG